METFTIQVTFFRRKQFRPEQFTDRFLQILLLSTWMKKTTLHVAAVGYVLPIIITSRNFYGKKIWVKKWLQKRNNLGAYNTIISAFH